jgi:hypothetical protein
MASNQGGKEYHQGLYFCYYDKYVPFDIDVSPQDNSGSKKEGVSWTYKNHDGYAPILAYLGIHGYMLNCEQRPGSQHSNKRAVEFLSECFDAIGELGLDNTLSRLDSAHDDANSRIQPDTEFGFPGPKNNNCQKTEVTYGI